MNLHISTQIKQQWQLESFLVGIAADYVEHAEANLNMLRVWREAYRKVIDEVNGDGNGRVEETDYTTWTHNLNPIFV